MTCAKPYKCSLNNHRNCDRKVIYHQRGEPLEDFATNSSDLSALVEGLQPNTDYSFQLRAYTSKGPGPWNNRLPFRTFGSCTCSKLPFTIISNQLMKRDCMLFIDGKLIEQVQSFFTSGSHYND